MSAPPDIRDIEALTLEDGEFINHLEGLEREGDGLIGAQVGKLSRSEIGSDGEMKPVFTGGTVVHYDAEAVTVVRMGRHYGKADATIDRIAYKEIVPEQSTRSTPGHRAKVARHICSVLGDRKGVYEGWERKLIGFAAALANH